MQEFVVGALVGRNHGLHAEFLFDGAAASAAHNSCGVRLAGEFDYFVGHRLRVGRWDDYASGACGDKVGITTYPGSNNWQAGGHGFKNSVGNAFGQRGQNKTVQAAHEFGDVAAFAGEPCEFGDPSSVE